METINITKELRLLPFQADMMKLRVALIWYQDKELLNQVNGTTESYDLERLVRMYDYQKKHGELYFIEIFDSGKWLPIGDVCLSRDDFAIVIGNRNYQEQGIGKLVLNAMIARAKSLGFDTIQVQEIYDFNKRSQNLFLSAGFKVNQLTSNGRSYCLKLEK